MQQVIKPQAELSLFLSSPLKLHKIKVESSLINDFPEDPSMPKKLDQTIVHTRNP